MGSEVYEQPMSVEIYTTPTCGYCHTAKRFLVQRGIAYVERDVMSDPVAAQEMVQLSGQQGVPVIVIDGQVVVGFDSNRLRQLLDRRANQPPQFGASIADARVITARKGLPTSEGAYVGQVRPGSPAERAGLRPDDIVVEVEGRRIRSAGDMETAISQLGAGRQIHVGYVRDGRVVHAQTML